MKFIHISDLHLGKSIHGISLIENGDQGFWVDRFLEKVKEISPDAVLIAGDVFDRKDPNDDAFELFSRLMTALNDMGITVMTIAGNHDSIQKLSYVSPVLSKMGLHFSRKLTETHELEHVTLPDEENGGDVTFWLMPYVFPALVAKAFDDSSIKDYETAVKTLLDAQDIDHSRRNVLIAHQNVTADGVAGEKGGSESMVGGVGPVDAGLFDGFDYVALGHIHAAYSIGRKNVRYAGSPLCYHFDETRQAAKGPVLVRMGAKGEPVDCEVLDIEPLHRMRVIGPDSYDNIRSRELANNNRNEYLKVILNDRPVTFEISSFFRDLFRGRESVLLDISSEFSRFTGKASARTAAQEEKSVEELFTDFYKEKNDGELPHEEDIRVIEFAGELARNARDIRKDPDPETIGKLIEYLLGTEEEQ